METTALGNFITEQKIEGSIFIISGVVALALALFFLGVIKYSFFKGMAVVFLLTGSLEIAEGTYTLATCQQKHYKINNNTGIVEDHESACIDKQLSHTEICRTTCIISGVAGILLLLVFYKSTQTFWKGMGLGLILKAVILVTLFSVKGSHLREYRQYKAYIEDKETSIPQTFGKKFNNYPA